MKRQVHIPQYMESFSCIGSACEDTCCSGWKIEIDQAAYTRYEKLTDPPVNPLLFMKRNDQSTHAENYGEVIPDAGDTCPLLNEHKLCTIHLNMGEKYLANLCATYPRSTNIVNGVYEVAATVSCPEAARLALLNPEGITFATKEESADNRHIVKNRLEFAKEGSLTKTCFQGLRSFTIQLLQNRSYPLEDRLMILGFFCQALQELISSNSTEEILGLADSYSMFIQDQAFGDRLSVFAVNPSAQMEHLRQLVDMRVFKGVKSRRYLQCLMHALQGIAYTSDALSEESVKLYNKAYTEYYAPYMKDHEYILENYLVNQVFAGLFPAAAGNRVFEAYAMLIIRYALIKFHLIGMAGFHKEAYGTDHVLTLIQSYAKTMEHNPAFAKEIINYLEKNNLLNIESMVIFIKNE